MQSEIYGLFIFARMTLTKMEEGNKLEYRSLMLIYKTRFVSLTIRNIGRIKYESKKYWYDEFWMCIIIFETVEF